jgi:hypothetical protein
MSNVMCDDVDEIFDFFQVVYKWHEAEGSELTCLQCRNFKKYGVCGAVKRIVKDIFGPIKYPILCQANGHCQLFVMSASQTFFRFLRKTFHILRKSA